MPKILSFHRRAYSELRVQNLLEAAAQARMKCEFGETSRLVQTVKVLISGDESATGAYWLGQANTLELEVLFTQSDKKNLADGVGLSLRAIDLWGNIGESVQQAHAFLRLAVFHSNLGWLLPRRERNEKFDVGLFCLNEGLGVALQHLSPKPSGVEYLHARFRFETSLSTAFTRKGIQLQAFKHLKNAQALLLSLPPTLSRKSELLMSQAGYFTCFSDKYYSGSDQAISELEKVILETKGGNDDLALVARIQKSLIPFLAQTNRKDEAWEILLESWQLSKKNDLRNNLRQLYELKSKYFKSKPPKFISLNSIDRTS